MPITFSCTCGKTLRVADEHAGKRVKCPACNTISTVPAPETEPVFEVVEPAPKPAPIPKPKRPWDDDEDEGGSYGIAKPGRPAARDDDEPAVGTYGISKPGSGEDEGPRDKPLPDFRLGSGQRGKKRKKK